MSRTHQLYHDLQQERIRSAALRLELYRVRQDKDALKTQLEAAHAELDALLKHGGDLMSYQRQTIEDAKQAINGAVCTTAAQYEALSIRRAGVDL